MLHTYVFDVDENKLMCSTKKTYKTIHLRRRKKGEGSCKKFRIFEMLFEEGREGRGGEVGR